jgi:prevent-host-death family protein
LKLGRGGLNYAKPRKASDMPTVNVHAAKSQLSRLLDAAVSGEEVIIAKAGKPMVWLVPIEAKKEERCKLGTLTGQFRVPDDFDDPLPDEMLDAFDGR